MPVNGALSVWLCRQVSEHGRRRGSSGEVERGVETLQEQAPQQPAWV